MLRKILAIFIIVLTLFSSAPIFAETQLIDDPSTLNIYFFWGEGCPHCAKEKNFLEGLETRNPDVDVYSFEVWKNAENRELMKKIGESFGIEITGVPFTVIGTQYTTGYASDNTTGAALEDVVDKCLENGCDDPVGGMLGFTVTDTKAPKPVAEEPKPLTDEHDDTDFISQEPESEEEYPEMIDIEITEDGLVKLKDHEEGASVKGLTFEESGIAAVAIGKIELPLIGEIDPTTISLPVLTILIGALDGFNPCAMWTLMFLISLLVGMENKRRMWALGSAFIVASAAVYFLFMSAWLNLLLFIGFIVWVRWIIGAVALGSGAYSIREFFVNKEGVCKVTHGKERQKVFEKLKTIVKNKSFWLAMGGIILLAFAVNLVELICSAGLPAVYTQVLTLSTIPTWQYYMYLLLYIFVFMLDDLFVFFISMATLQMTGLTTKYSRWARLIGGALIFILGILLIFKPEWLMFG